MLPDSPQPPAPKPAHPVRLFTFPHLCSRTWVQEVSFMFSCPQIAFPFKGGEKHFKNSRLLNEKLTNRKNSQFFKFFQT